MVEISYRLMAPDELTHSIRKAKFMGRALTSLDDVTDAELKRFFVAGTEIDIDYVRKTYTVRGPFAQGRYTLVRRDEVRKLAVRPDSRHWTPGEREIVEAGLKEGLRFGEIAVRLSSRSARAVRSFVEREGIE